MKILELFSGYGTASFALKRLGIPYEIVGYSDIDKYANQCFQQNHGGKQLGDVKLINPSDLEDFDLLTGGFPCQSFSNAGKGLGESDPRGTLFYEIIRIAEVKQPKYMLLENVKGLTCKKFKDTFDKILSQLDRIGYNVYWKVLNSKDFGIPQSRARVWFVCFRKDIDKKDFNFPEPVELKIFIKDILEPVVDPKYYLSEKLQERFRKYLEEKETQIIQRGRGFNEGGSKDLCPTIGSHDWHQNNILSIIRGRPKMPYEQGKRELEYKEYTDVCPTLSQNCASGDQKNIVAMRQRGNGEDKAQELEPREDGCSNSLTSVQKDNLVADIQVLGSLDSEGWEKRHEQIRRIYGTNGIMATLPTGQGGGVIPKIMENKVVQDVANTIKVGGRVTDPSYYYEKKNDNFAISSTLTTELAHSTGRDFIRSGQADNILKSSGQLRRLTPKECFRLMGFLNDEINLEGLSDTQRYKLAGNGQDVNVVSLIFKEMFR